MAKTVFFDKDGKPQLLTSYCVFVDLLGFRHEIRAAVSSGSEKEVFDQFMSVVEPEIQRTMMPQEDEGDDRFPRCWDAKVFTDNVVLGYPIHSHGESEFGFALTQLLEFQLHLALEGYFVRGGWSVGLLFMNQNTIYGSALLDAYDLEQEHAVYPRVILSEGVKDFVYHHMAFYAEHPPQCQHLLCDANGMLMTNYLSEVIGDEWIEWDWLVKHAKQISLRLEQYSGTKKVFAKYEWLAAYHNFFCDLLKDSEEYAEDVRVKGTFPDAGLRLLTREDSPYPPSPKRRWW